MEPKRPLDIEAMKALLPDLLHEQAKHDLLAHQGVVNWDEHKRLIHYTLHLAKYTAKFAQSWRTPGLAIPRTAFVDTFIICLAAALCEGVQLAKVIRPDDGRSEGWLSQFPSHMLELVGRMSKLCEGRDHGEPLDYDEAWEDCIADLATVVLRAAEQFQIDLPTETRSRWRQLEAAL